MHTITRTPDGGAIYFYKHAPCRCGRLGCPKDTVTVLDPKIVEHWTALWKKSVKSGWYPHIPERDLSDVFQAFGRLLADEATKTSYVWQPTDRSGRFVGVDLAAPGTSSYTVWYLAQDQWVIDREESIDVKEGL